MKFWIDGTKWVKSKSPTGAFDFFTYSELIWWFTFVSRVSHISGSQCAIADSEQCVAINPFRWKWAVFVFLGIGIDFPQYIVDKEDDVRNGIGMPADEKSHTY